jgi:hypothetical protein
MKKGGVTSLEKLRLRVTAFRTKLRVKKMGATSTEAETVADSDL